MSWRVPAAALVCASCRKPDCRGHPQILDSLGLASRAPPIAPPAVHDPLELELGVNS